MVACLDDERLARNGEMVLAWQLVAVALCCSFFIRVGVNAKQVNCTG